ncbi:hypothetical protein KP509_01G057900 [Ceratopteris richardii]|uniref:Uncharacterized protein n=1 Tax=Ceratopteris richardii TaxID=49495 RepID=A0A8T2VH93_CERRI|nr:hypothetical protein KP509_01G057900 [Ceratopteris richardii]
MEETVKALGFDIEKQDYKMNLRGLECGQKPCLSIATEVFEVTPTLFMIGMRKDDGDTLEYRKFCDNFSTALKDVVWNTEAESSGSVV